MINREEYLKALSIVIKYRNQSKEDLNNSNFIEEINGEKLLSDCNIEFSNGLKGNFGYNYKKELYKKDGYISDISAFNMIKLSDLKKYPFRLVDIKLWRGFGKTRVAEVSEIYKKLGL